MANGLEFIDGRLQFTGSGAGTDPFAPDEQFFDQSVPGAAQAAPQLDITAPVNAAAGAVQAEQVQQAQTEQTEQERMQAEQRKKAVKAKKAELAAQKAQLDAADAGADAGFVPANQQVIPEGLAAATPGQELQPPEDVVDPVGQALVDQGFKRTKTGAAQAAGVASSRGTAEADAIFAEGGQVLDAVEEQARIEGKRQEVQKLIADTGAQVQAEIDKDVTAPSPSSLGLIGVFLNGLIAPYQGGRNVALEIVQKQIQREVDLELRNKKDRIAGLDRKLGIAGQQSDEIGREAIATGIITAQKIKGFKMQLQSQIESKHIPAETAAQLQQFIGDLEIKQGEAQKAAALTASREALKQAQFEQRRLDAAAKRSRRRGGGGGGRVPATKQQERTVELLKGAGLDPKKLANRELIGTVKVKGPDGKSKWGFVGTGAAAMKAFNKKAVAAERNLDVMGELAKLIQAEGGGVDFKIGKSEHAARIQALYSKLLVDLKTQFELGAISGPDMELMQGVIGRDPAAWNNLTPDAALASLEELYNMSNSDMSAAVRSNSLGGSEYAPRLSWGSLTKPTGSGRRRTANEQNLHLDKVVSEISDTDTDEVKAERAQEVTGIADRFLSDGIGPSNVKAAKDMLKKLDQIPREQRRTFSSPTDRLSTLGRAIREYEAKGGSKARQKKVQAKQKKGVKQDKEAKARKQRILEMSRKASLKR